MAKTIIFNDIQLKSVELYENEGKVFVYTLYSLKDNNGKEWEEKRHCLKDFNKTEIENIQDIIKVAKNKIKVIEKI